MASRTSRRSAGACASATSKMSSSWICSSRRPWRADGTAARAVDGEALVALPHAVPGAAPDVAAQADVPIGAPWRSCAAAISW
eukprot:2818240-Prymnesium_polylepis.1